MDVLLINQVRHIHVLIIPILRIYVVLIVHVHVLLIIIVMRMEQRMNGVNIIRNAMENLLEHRFALQNPAFWLFQPWREDEIPGFPEKSVQRSPQNTLFLGTLLKENTYESNQSQHVLHRDSCCNVVDAGCGSNDL